MYIYTRKNENRFGPFEALLFLSLSVIIIIVVIIVIINIMMYNSNDKLYGVVCLLHVTYFFMFARCLVKAWLLEGALIHWGDIHYSRK